MDRSLAHQILEAQLNTVSNSYISWLGVDFHKTRIPRMFDNGEVMVIFSIEPGEERYDTWLTWTVHGLDQVYKLRLQAQHHECIGIELLYENPVALEEGQKVVGYILRDIHDELKSYAERNNFPSMNIQVF